MTIGVRGISLIYNSDLECGSGAPPICRRCPSYMPTVPPLYADAPFWKSKATLGKIAPIFFYIYYRHYSVASGERAADEKTCRQRTASPAAPQGSHFSRNPNNFGKSAADEKTCRFFATRGLSRTSARRID